MPEVSQLYKLGSQQGKGGGSPLPGHTPWLCYHPCSASSTLLLLASAHSLSGSAPSAVDGCPEARQRGWGLICHPQVPEASLGLVNVHLQLRPKTLSLLEAEGPHEPCDALCLGKEEAGSSLGFLAFSLSFKRPPRSPEEPAEGCCRQG